MKSKILIGVVLIMGSCFWSCESDHILPNDITEMQADLNSENVGLKSGTIGGIGATDAYEIPVQHKDIEVGTMFVMNSFDFLIVRFTGNMNYNLELVQLWVGTDPEELPSNSINKPTPGKFPMINSGTNNFIFLVPKNQISNDFQFDGGDKLFLVAHIETSNIQTGERISAWSEGAIFSPKSSATISEYNPSLPKVGGGCYPFIANCGSLENNSFYFNTNHGIQSILVSTGKNTYQEIGSLYFDSGNFIFSFDEGWMLTDLLTPTVIITGYDVAGINAQEVYAGPPTEPEESTNYNYYYGPVDGYNYYTVELKVQFCF